MDISTPQRPALLLAFDTETTGLTLHPDAAVDKQPKMIEFGGVLVSLRDGSIVEEIEILVNPGEPLEAIITKITGLTDDDLKDAAPFKDVLPQIARVFAAADVCVAHNLPFDKAIVHGELARNGITEFPWPRREACTVGLYREAWGRNPKLLELYESVMGKPLAQTHRALDDVLAMVEIIQKEELWRIL
jgi:DNA polymerase III epsilon subunit-like protein